MKKYILAFLAAVLFLCLTACGKETTQGNQMSSEKQAGGNQKVYYDLEVTENLLWKQEDEASGSFRRIGVQFYQGEPVCILAEEAENTERIDIYLQGKDGNKKLLCDNLSREYLQYTVLLDEAGDLYFYSADAVVRLDGDGREAYRSSVARATQGMLRDICRLPDNRFLVWAADSSTSKKTLWVMDAADGKFAEKGIELNILGLGYIAAGETGAYLLNYDGVWSVDESDGNLSSAFSFKGTSYVLSPSDRSRTLIDFQVSGEGVLEILWRKDGAVIWETLKRQAVENKTVIVLRTTSIGGTQYKEWVAEFNKTSERYQVVVEECPEGTDDNDFVTQTLIQFAAKKGADLYLGNEMRSTLWSLIENGTFEDLTPYMEASGIREEDYFSYVFETWKQDGKIYGVNLNVTAQSCFISKEIMGDYGAPDSVEELADALLAYEENAFLMDGYTSQQVLEWFLMGSESLWGMLDWEAGTCDFSGELFAKLLEVSKRYGYNERNSYPELISILHAWMFDQYIISENVQGEGNVPAGPFFDAGCYACADDYCTISISATSANKEGAWEFIEFCISDEIQASAKRPIQKAAFWKSAEARIADDKAKELRGDLFAAPMTLEKAETMAQIIDSSRPYPIRTEPILDIVCGEAEEYFNGTKSIEEVAAVIENRVALYMEENK